MRACRLTNAQLEAEAERHSQVAEQSKEWCAPHEEYHLILMEVFQELLDHRARLGDA